MKELDELQELLNKSNLENPNLENPNLEDENDGIDHKRLEQFFSDPVDFDTPFRPISALTKLNDLMYPKRGLIDVTKDFYSNPWRVSEQASAVVSLYLKSVVAPAAGIATIETGGVGAVAPLALAGIFDAINIGLPIAEMFFKDVARASRR